MYPFSSDHGSQARPGWASTVMGDRTGTPGDVGLPFLLFGSRGTEGLPRGLASMITVISLPVLLRIESLKGLLVIDRITL